MQVSGNRLVEKPTASRSTGPFPNFLVGIPPQSFWSRSNAGCAIGVRAGLFFFFFFEMIIWRKRGPAEREQGARHCRGKNAQKESHGGDDTIRKKKKEWKRI